MLCKVDSPGRPAFFLKDGGGVNLGDNRCRGWNWEKENVVGCPSVYVLLLSDNE